MTRHFYVSEIWNLKNEKKFKKYIWLGVSPEMFQAILRKGETFTYEDSRLSIKIGWKWSESFHASDTTTDIQVYTKKRSGFFKRLRKKLKEAEAFFLGTEDDMFSALDDIKKQKREIEAISRWELSRKNA